MDNFITEVDIIDESRESFLTYSSEVLTDRAIPAAEDGLLSAQRKIIWTMEDFLKMDNKSKTKKCNAIVGSTLSTSYFHGDISCYGVLCKMSQEYLMRYPLITGQGSLGTQENNDMVASSRYTEAKPSKFADLMMNDFKKKVVPLKETYNGEYMEPIVLPSLFPNAICNGRQAIGISMSHNSLPHNLTEVCNGIIAYIKNNNLTIDELMEYIKGPDFPLENVIINGKDIKSAFMTGHSAVSLKVRGKYKIDKQTITFTTIPYRTYRNKIKEQIEKNIDVFDNLLVDFNDESSLGKNKLVFTVKPGVEPEKVVTELFALTDLQSSVSYNMNYIVNGTPKMCSMLDLIKAYVNHQINVLIAATEYDKDKAEKRAHILEGLLIVLEDIDKAIKLIRESLDSAEAKVKLINAFNLTEVQAKAVLDMKLSRLTKLDRDDILKELKDKKAIIEECNKIINDEQYRNVKLIEKIEGLKKVYGDERRTTILDMELPKTSSKKSVPPVKKDPVDVVVVTTHSGLIKKIPVSSFKPQSRGGVGVKTLDSAIMSAIKTNTEDIVMFFTNGGKVCKLIADKIPDGTNAAKGTPVSSLINLDKGDNVIAVTSLHNKSIPKYIIFVTKEGMIKKSLLSDYMTGSRGGNLIAIKLKENDVVKQVIFQDEEDIIIATKNGMGLRIATNDITPVGRVAMGIKGIKLGEGDEVVSALPIHKETDDLGIFYINGCGYKRKISDITVRTRNTKGTTIGSSDIAGIAMISNEDNLIISGDINTICISAKDIPVYSSAATGVILIKSNMIKSITKI